MKAVTESWQPSTDEISQERCLFWILTAEAISISILAVFAVVTGSLTLAGAVLRASLAVLSGYCSLWVLRRKHRHRFGWLEFGSGKLERLLSGVYGAVMFAFAVFLTSMIINAILNYGAQPTPVDRAVAAIARSLNLLVITIGFIATYYVARKTRSQILATQLQVMSVMLICTFLVQITLTFSAMAENPAAAFGWDIAGALFVAVLMFRAGAKMVVASLPDLLDASVSEAELKEAKSLVMQFFRPHEISSMQSRRSGVLVMLEVELYQSALSAADAGLTKINLLRDGLKRLDRKVEVSVMIGPEQALNSNSASSANAGPAGFL
ncbi:MAG: cation transporter [Rhizobiaceae bacterium]